MSLNKLEDHFNFLVKGRRPQFFVKWKTTSIFLYTEDELKFLANGRQLHLFVNGRQLQTFNTGNTKTKTISTSGKAVLAWTELGTAQPQLVFFTICIFNYGIESSGLNLTTSLNPTEMSLYSKYVFTCIFMWSRSGVICFPFAEAIKGNRILEILILCPQNI